MMMIIHRSPIFSDEPLAITRNGDVLTINGSSFDFANVAEGDCLPASALDSDFVISDVTRKDGAITLTVLWPHGIDAEEAERFPQPFTPENGPTGESAAIDWSQLSTASDREAAALLEERENMKCSRLQGRLVLGEVTCDALDAMAADLATPWAMRQTILNASEWQRTSEAMDELGYVLGYDPEQMDDLFRVAMTVRG